MIRNILHKILKPAAEKLSKGAGYFASNWIEIILKIIYIAILFIIVQNIFAFSYKSWLYPIKLYHYYDECSYLSMGKYFRIFSPFTLFKDYLLKNKPIPPLYHEFHSRAIYWSYILSFPMKYSTDVEYLHNFRALFLTIGTLIFFFIGHKLAGFTGGIVASAFWIGTPILNYWGKFFMTGIPSLVFIAAGYLFLLYSDRSRFSALFGGFFIGVGAFTRFTAILLAFPAPFFIIAIFFNPFKRKNYQIIGELAKTLAGFVFGTMPFLVFSGLLYRNPLQPFYAARSAVNNYPADDPGYYIRNIWIEGGLLIQIGAFLAITAVVILAISWGFKQSALNEKKGKNPLLNLVYFPKSFISGLLYYGIIVGSLILTTSVYLIGITGIPHKLPRYIIGGIVPLIIIAAIGFGAIEKLVLQILRIPVKRINAYLNSFLLNIAEKLKHISPIDQYKKIQNGIINFYLRLKKTNILFNLDYIKKPSKRSNPLYYHYTLRDIPRIFNTIAGYFQKKFRRICSVWIIIAILLIVVLSISIYYLKQIPLHVWDSTMNRSFDFKYDIPEDIEKNTHKNTLRRLQPEYNFATPTQAGIRWDMSINEKLKLIEKDPKKAYSELRYLYRSYPELYEELNNIMKPTEVLYVDRLSLIPFTPGYIAKASVWIDDHIQYGYSLSTLIRRGYFPYNGYVIVHKNSKEEFFKDEKKETEEKADEETGDEKTDDEAGAKKEEKEYDYFRSINLPAVKRHNSFSYVTSVDRFEIYRYSGGVPFPYFPGVKSDNTEPVPETGEQPDSGEQKDKKATNPIIQFLKEQYVKYFDFWLRLFQNGNRTEKETENGKKDT